MEIIRKYKTELENILRKNSSIKRFYLFGSVLNTNFNVDESDIDVLIETADIAPEQKGEQLLILWDSLENLFGRKVDMLTENSLNNPYFVSEVKRTRKLIYDGQTKQIFI